MPKRTVSQKKGDQAEAFVCYLVEKHDRWICRKTDKDYGVDFELELQLAEGEVAGKILKLQVKSRSEFEIDNGFIKLREEKEFIKYAVRHAAPFVLIVVDLKKETTYYLSLRDWYRDQRGAINIDAPYPASVDLRVPITDTLQQGLSGPLIELAEGRTASADVELSGEAGKRNGPQSISSSSLQDVASQAQESKPAQENKNKGISQTRSDMPGYSSMLTLKGPSVTLYAHLPVFPKLTGSCAFYFNKPSIEDCGITLNHDDILKQLFRGLRTKPEYGLRGFIVGKAYPERDEITVDLGNCRFSLSNSEVLELCEIVDRLAEEYLAALRICEGKFEIAAFSDVRMPDGVPLVRINRQLWQKMIEFTNLHNMSNGDSDWHIFDASHGMIKIYTNRQTDRLNRGYHAFLVPEQVRNGMKSFTRPDDEVYVVWKLPVAYLSTKEVSALNGRDVWDAISTYRWLINEFIPYVLYYFSNQRKKKSFIEFSKELDIERDISLAQQDGYPSPDTIEDVQALERLTSRMQMFFNGRARGSAEFSAEEIKELYESLNLALTHSKLIDGDLIYIRGHLPFENRDSHSNVLELVANHIASITTADVVSNFQIDLALRCLSTAIEDASSSLNRHEVKEIVSALRPFLLLMEREELIERNMNWLAT